MITRINARAEFKKGGDPLVVNFQPKEGITAVVGPNGVGKTFAAQESLRYLLFGTSALRAKLDTYTTLDVSGEVRIHNQPYGIQRNLKDAKITDRFGNVLAVGQSEVTNKITELLGYNLDVFDLCNASVQGKTQALGDLRPAARKELIDKVLRVSDVRVVEKALRDEANGLKREAAALESAMPALPPKPEKPEGYRPSEDILKDINDARELRKQRDALSSQLKHVTVPDAPEGNPITDETIELIREKEDLEYRSQFSGEEPLTKEQIQIARDRYEWEKEEERRGPKPSISKEELKRQSIKIAEYETIQGMQDVEATCPKCDHQFNTRPELPDLSDCLHKTELIQQKRAHENWSEDMPEEPSAAHGTLTERGAEQMLDRIDDWNEAKQARKELADRQWPELTMHQARNQRAEWDAYKRLKAQFDAAEIDNAMIQRQLDDMPEVPDVDKLSELYYACGNWETKSGIYDDAVIDRDTRKRQIAEKLEQADQFLEGDKELSEARAELKSALAPMLTREATALIHDMTNGVLQSLTVDEDMHIIVDGQTLETLSGAGKTVANIALRIALAKTLTGSAFPVFIGDEMDGDLDHKRREATTQAMLSLKAHLKQIILITHKDVDVADHVVDLGEKS